MKTIPFANLPAHYRSIRREILRRVESSLASGSYILGDTVGKFEEEFRAYCGTRYAVSVANGTDALILSLKALGIGPGDEVITAPNSFLASASCIAIVGAKPVFVDVKEDLTIDPDRLAAAITPRTKAVIPVHLTGRPADMRSILAVSRRHGLAVIEDVAQAVGAKYRGQRVGSFGIAGCFSFHPLKNLNAFGDGGLITTNDRKIHDYLLKARNHGLKSRDECQFFSGNSRLDALQAAILSFKLRHLERWIRQRRKVAEFYRNRMAGLVDVPREKSHEYAVYQTFIIQSGQRDRLKAYLEGKGIETKVHYPVPIHLQEAARYLGYRKGDFPVTERQAGRVLSLPIYPELTRRQLDHVCRSLRAFFKGD